MRIQSITDYQQSFRTGIKNETINGIVNEAKSVSEPFLTTHKPLIERIYTLRKNFAKDLSVLNNYINIPEYKTTDFKEVKRLRLGEIDSLLQEFFYLSEKSERWFVSSDVATKYAEEIGPLFDVPECLSDSFFAYKQLQKDIYNGLNGRNLPKNLKEKFYGLNEGEKKLGLITSPYNSVEREKRNIDIYCSSGENNIDKFRYSLNNMKDSINFHNEYLSDINKRFSQAESIYNQYALTQEDIKLISSNPQQKIISRCVSKFNKKVAGVSLTEEDNIAIDKRLKQQEEVLEILYNKIEVCKKNTFSPKPQQEIPCDCSEDMPF